MVFGNSVFRNNTTTSRRSSRSSRSCEKVSVEKEASPRLDGLAVAERAALTRGELWDASSGFQRCFLLGALLFGSLYSWSGSGKSSRKQDLVRGSLSRWPF